MTLCHCVITCRVYIPYPFQWGSPTFHAGEAFAMMAASFVSLFEVHFWTTITCISCLLASYSATKLSNLLLKAETSLQQIMHLNSDFLLTMWICKTKKNTCPNFPLLFAVYWYIFCNSKIWQCYTCATFRYWPWCWLAGRMCLCDISFTYHDSLFILG